MTSKEIELFKQGYQGKWDIFPAQTIFFVFGKELQPFFRLIINNCWGTH